jgi:SH3-domain binding protein 5
VFWEGKKLAFQKKKNTRTIFTTVLFVMLILTNCQIIFQLESEITQPFSRSLQVQQLEERFRRSIQKSRPYFDEKQICQDQLQTQKERIQQIQSQLQQAKNTYSTSLRSLEQISEEIHRSRSNKGDLSNAAPSGVREPGVGAEHIAIVKSPSMAGSSAFAASLPDFTSELDKCDERSSQCVSMATSSAVSERDPTEGDPNDDLDLEYLRQKVKFLAVRPVESADGQQQDQDIWENELNATVNKLDHLMMMRESASNLLKQPTAMTTPTNNFSLPTTPLRSDVVTITNNTPVKQTLPKVDPLPLANVNVSMLNVSSISNFSFLPDSWAAQRYGCGDSQQKPIGASKPVDQPLAQNKRKLSLQ